MSKDTQVKTHSPASSSGKRHDLQSAIDQAISYLLAIQDERGYWWGELESNVTITAEHLFLTHIMGTASDKEWRKIANYLLEKQGADGTWAIWHEGAGDLSVTVEAYLALKLAGISSERPEMAKARDFILTHGGVERSRVFTKIWLAMLGQWNWHSIPMMPPELILLPNWFPINIYSFACWARGTVIPMTIIQTLRPVFPLPKWAHINELFVGNRGDTDLSFTSPASSSLWSTSFRVLDRALRIYDRSPFKPFRRHAIRKAEQWITQRQEEDGSWGGIQPPWVYSLIALKALGYTLDHPIMKKGWSGFYGKEGFAIEEEQTFHMQSCLSPVWDTALAMIALEDANVSPDHPMLVNAGSWLLDEQIFSGGDWQVHCGGRPGGWAFEFANDLYPDTDDSAIVLMALMGAHLDEKRKGHALKRGLEWLLAMQSANGGWGAFDRNNTRILLREIPFADFGEMVDPPSVDVTAHIVECLARAGHKKGSAPLDHAIHYIKQEQEKDGAWFGRWGVNLIYGIGCVLPALAAAGEEMNCPYIRRALDWLIAHQNEDGGWGERVEGYQGGQWRGKGSSTASQTAWALLGLLAAKQVDHRATRRGIDYLLNTQNDQGNWDEPYFTGTGFPGDFMINYHLYRDYFPLMALSRYRTAVGDKR